MDFVKTVNKISQSVMSDYAQYVNATPVKRTAVICDACARGNHAERAEMDHAGVRCHCRCNHRGN